MRTERSAGYLIYAIRSGQEKSVVPPVDKSGVMTTIGSAGTGKPAACETARIDPLRVGYIGFGLRRFPIAAYHSPDYSRGFSLSRRRDNSSACNGRKTGAERCRCYAVTRATSKAAPWMRKARAGKAGHDYPEQSGQPGKRASPGP